MNNTLFKKDAAAPVVRVAVITGAARSRTEAALMSVTGARVVAAGGLCLKAAGLALACCESLL